MLTDDGKPVHYPANPTRFEFDAEVAQVFKDMAERAIPNFHLAHEMHARMAAKTLDAPGARVLDIGASRGAFLQHLKSIAKPGFSYTAVDVSKPMCDLLSEEYPEAIVRCLDVTSPEFAQTLNGESYDVVCVNYVLQFLQPGMQYGVLDLLSRAVRRGGLLFLGHKSVHYGFMGDEAHERYIEWRIQNGYSREEIEAKTKALRGSMFPMRHAAVLSYLQGNFEEVQETTRFMMFSTVAARK